LIKNLKNTELINQILKKSLPISTTGIEVKYLNAKSYLISTLSGEKIEKFYAILLNSGNKVTDCLEIESGTINKFFLIQKKFLQKLWQNTDLLLLCSNNHLVVVL
jgi:DNA repair protein RadC